MQCEGRPDVAVVVVQKEGEEGRGKVMVLPLLGMPAGRQRRWSPALLRAREYLQRFQRESCFSVLPRVTRYPAVRTSILISSRTIRRLRLLADRTATFAFRSYHPYRSHSNPSSNRRRIIERWLCALQVRSAE